MLLLLLRTTASKYDGDKKKEGGFFTAASAIQLGSAMMSMPSMPTPSTSRRRCGLGRRASLAAGDSPVAP